MQLNIEEYKTFFPNDLQLSHDIERFNTLQSANKVRIVVFGKYNHGKSSLLNAIIGQNVFSVSDKRETTVNQEMSDNRSNIIWMDTPGLDADPNCKDDFEANKGAFVSADILLLVHSLKVGELDQSEVEHFKRVERELGSIKKLLIITKIDEIPDADNRKKVLETIKKQFPQFELIETSAARYVKGMIEHKEKLVELSGIPILSQRIYQLVSDVPQARKVIRDEVRNKIEQRLQREINRLNSQIQTNRNRILDRRSKFEQAINRCLNEIEQF